MTVWRVIIGFAVVALALWVIVGEQITGASADATVNGRLTTLRSPVAGEISMPQRALGSTLASGEVVASVRDQSADSVRLDDLKMEAGFEEAAITRYRTLRDETAAVIGGLYERSERFASARIAELELRLDYARERLALLKSEPLPEVFGLRPPDSTDVDSGEASYVPGLRKLWIKAVEEQISILENELKTARQGVFLGDGYNDAPHAEQRIMQLETELSRFSTQLAEAEARFELVKNRLADERVRVSLTEGSEIVSPVVGVYWEALASDKQYVSRGDPVARVLDCDSIVVTLSVTESVYNTLRVGDEAVYRPRGENRNFAATILRLAGAGAETLYRNLAVAPSERHLERYDVMVLVPELNSDPELGCAIGRTGRVFFERRPLDWLRSLRG